MQLSVHDLTFSYGKGRPVLDRVDLELEPCLTVIVGPNGAGKSTLVKCLAGVLDVGAALRLDGAVIAGGRGLQDYTSHLSYMPQHAYHPAAITVLESVLLGMVHSLSLRVDEEALQQAMQALTDLEIADLAERPLNELSGGQQQLVSMAQAIVRDPRILLLDEPLNNLDIHHQLEMLDLVSRLTRERGMITVLTLHDLNFAARYADRIVVIRDGCIYGSGGVSDMLTREMIQNVYGVEAEVTIDASGRPRMYFLRAYKGPVIQVPE